VLTRLAGDGVVAAAALVSGEVELIVTPPGARSNATLVVSEPLPLPSMSRHGVLPPAAWHRLKK
jgi:hypothetical protein